jgi:hypothetical protein
LVKSIELEDVEDEEDDDELVGLPNLSKQHNGPASTGSLGVLLVLCVLMMLVVGALAVFAMVRRRYKHNLYGGRNVLTFANPNYNAQDAGSASGAAGADRRPFLWKKLKYEKPGPVSVKASTSSLGSSRHDEGIILCAVPELKTSCNLHSIMVDKDFEAVTTNVDDKHDEIYSEITVPEVAK